MLSIPNNAVWKGRLCVASAWALVLWGLAGCGQTEKSVLPPVVDNNPFESARVGTDTTLEVMTWNLQNFAKKGSLTADYVVDAVRGMDVDIIALQEIENLTYFRQVREGLDSWDGDRATSAGYSVNLAFLYRIDGPVEVTAIYEILVEYSREFPRRPFVLEGRFEDRPFVVINNHFKCCGNGTIEEAAWDEETRRRDAGLLLDAFIRENFSGQAVFVVGDFNDSLTDVPEQNVFQMFFDAPELYRFVDLSIAQGPKTGWSFPTWPSHLDHIMITDALFVSAQGDDAEVMVAPLHTYLPNGWSTYGSSISDHLPVLLKLKP